MRYWRAQGIRCTMFFDDGSGGASSFDRAVEVADVLQGTLDKAGWKVNVGKSRWVPSQRPSILGFELELVNGSVYVSEGRVKRLREYLKGSFAKRGIRQNFGVYDFHII